MKRKYQEAFLYLFLALGVGTTINVLGPIVIQSIFGVRAMDCKSCKGIGVVNDAVDGMIRCPRCHGSLKEDCRRCSICKKDVDKSIVGRWAHGVMWVCSEQCLNDAYGD